MKRRPIRKWIVRSLLVSFLLFLLFLGKVYWDWRSTRRAGEEHLARVMKELDESEPGWREVFDNRNQRLAPPERNSANLALTEVQSLPKPVSDWMKRLELPDVDPNLIPSDELQKDIRLNLEPVSASVAKLRQLTTTLPNSGFRFHMKEPNPLDTLMEDQQQFRRVSHMLKIDTLRLIAENRPDEAVHNVRALCGAPRAFGDEPVLISQLVRMALAAIAVNVLENVLGTTEPRRELDILQRELHDESEFPRFRVAMTGERYFFFHMLENLDNGTMTIAELASEKPDLWSRVSYSLFSRYLPEQQAYALELATNLIRDNDLPQPERSQSVADRLAQIHFLNRHHYSLIRLIMPAMDKVEQADQRIVTQLRCAVVALACERFRIANGRWPSTLGEIPKSILANVPNDPFTGEPLMMTRTEVGLNIYSTGKDGIDDGGEVLNPKMEFGSDIGFRLYDPAHRRKPAPVQKPIDDEEKMDP